MPEAKVIIGAGLYGLYAALFCAKQGDSVTVLEYESSAFSRATYVNQARVHMGYHYPRSLSTAVKSKGYFDRFSEEFSFCIDDSFEQIYSTSSNFSWTNASQFRKFCKSADIKCEDVSPAKYFNEGMCDGAFISTEFAYDALILKEHLFKEIEKYPNINIQYDTRIVQVNKSAEYFEVITEKESYKTSFVLNATYASINQIHDLFGVEPFNVKYELCEIILCKVNESFKNVGITVMDGPFFSIMPFGKTGYHSLTSVTFTPHIASYDKLPTFSCQSKSNGYCSLKQLGNCNFCPVKPKSAWDYMSKLARKYLNNQYEFEYVDSLFSVKPILKASEMDDSRPTLIRKFSEKPTFISVLSGKINTVYDLDEVLINEN